MSTEEKVSLTLSIEKMYRDRLRTMAAQQNLNHPDQLTSASTLAREIICEYIRTIVGFGEECREPEVEASAPSEAELNELFQSAPNKNETNE